MSAPVSEHAEPFVAPTSVGRAIERSALPVLESIDRALSRLEERGDNLGELKELLQVLRVTMLLEVGFDDMGRAAVDPGSRRAAAALLDRARTMDTQRFAGMMNPLKARLDLANSKYPTEMLAGYMKQQPFASLFLSPEDPGK